MRGKYNSNSNDSLFSLEYKIPYEKSSIEQHLEESQEEINFIKIKLTEAYEKLEQEIKNNTELEEQSEFYARRAKEWEEKYHCEKKENVKLKETLELILKNRKIMQEDIEQQREANTRKLADRDAIIDNLQKQLKTLSQNHSSLMAQFEEKSRLLKEYSDRLREESEQDDHRQAFLNSKIEVLEQQIAKITEQKYIQVTRLRHQLQLYQRSGTPIKELPEPKKQERQQLREDYRELRKREFSRPAIPRKQLVPPKFDTRVSEESQSSDFNKENMHSLQLNIPNASLAESSISKWRRPQSVKDSQKDASLCVPIPAPSEDQQLTQYQMARKKAEQELCALEKIKRPSNEQRDKMARLEREIYHLDSDIAGLKRKIRRKY